MFIEIDKHELSIKSKQSKLKVTFLLKLFTYFIIYCHYLFNKLVLIYIYILLKVEAWHLLLLSSCCTTSSPRDSPLNYYLLFILFLIIYIYIYIYKLLTLHIHLCRF